MAAPLEFEELQWRIDVPLGSRHPDPTTDTGDVEMALRLGLVRQDPDPANPPVPTEAWLRADYATLVRLTQAMEEAVAALHGPPYGRIHRQVK